jgi:hypothetical protein
MKILIATSRFMNLAGSEITALELSEVLREKNFEVTIASMEIGGIPQIEAESVGVRVVEITSKILIDEEWGLIWIFHPVTYYMIFAKLKVRGKIVIYSSWSHFEPLESPPITLQPIDLYTVNSLEHFRFFSDKYPALIKKTTFLKNCVPPSFSKFLPCKKVIEKFYKVVIVSNHPPQELLDAIDILRLEGMQIDIFGNDGLVRRVTPEILSEYDAVVTIGKTVQYGLALQMPVFCYDHFGGPGWITEENINKAAEYNFSGRCSGQRLEPMELVSKFKAIDNDRLQEREYLRQYILENSDLTKNVLRVLRLAEEFSVKRIDFDLLSLSEGEMQIFYLGKMRFFCVSVICHSN